MTKHYCPECKKNEVALDSEICQDCWIGFNAECQRDAAPAQAKALYRIIEGLLPREVAVALEYRPSLAGWLVTISDIGGAIIHTTLLDDLDDGSVDDMLERIERLQG